MVDTGKKEKKGKARKAQKEEDIILPKPLMLKFTKLDPNIIAALQMMNARRLDNCSNSVASVVVQQQTQKS